MAFCLRKTRAMALYRWLLRGVFISLMSLGLANAYGAPIASEASVKAVYLYNFAKFTRWPESAFERDTSPIRICVLGSAEVTENLQAVLLDKHVDERAVLASNVNDPTTQLRGCHLIYQSAGAKISKWELLRLAQDLPVLTIGEGSEFLDLGGALAFVIENQRIRFEVNLPAANRAGVNLSARLMNVARHVRQP